MAVAVQRGNLLALDRLVRRREKAGDRLVMPGSIARWDHLVGAHADRLGASPAEELFGLRAPARDDPVRVLFDEAVDPRGRYARSVCRKPRRLLE